MSGKRRVLSQKGFSLLEVLIAVTVLSVGLLGVAMFQITAIKGNAVANEAVIATYFAQERIEILRRTPYDNVVTSAAGIASHQPNYAVLTPTNAAIESTQTKNGIRVYRVWDVVNTTATLKEITVWGCWADEKGRWHTVQLVTRKGNVS